jgi:polyphosphate kinase 2 (PPK2 family)
MKSHGDVDAAMALLDRQKGETMNEHDADDVPAKMKRKHYEKELRTLQTELCRLQEWIKLKGLRVIVVFEGRDAAGKGGTIKAITERVSPRVFRVLGSGTNAVVFPALHAALPECGGSRHL